MPLLTVGASRTTTEILKESLATKFNLINETNAGSYTFMTFNLNPDDQSLFKFSSDLTYLIFDQLQTRWLERLLSGR